MMVSFTRTPAHATRMPSGGSDFEVDPLYFAARISLEAYEHVGEAFSTRSAFSPQCSHCVIACAVAGGKDGLGSYTGLAPSLSLNIWGSMPFMGGGSVLVLLANTTSYSPHASLNFCWVILDSVWSKTTLLMSIGLDSYSLGCVSKYSLITRSDRLHVCTTDCLSYPCLIYCSIALLRLFSSKCSWLGINRMGMCLWCLTA